MDRLKEISTQLGGVINQQNHSNFNFKERSVRELTVKNYKDYKISIDDFGEIFFTKIKVDCEFSISINNPDKLSSIDHLIEHSFYKLYIFTESYSEFLLGHRYNPFLDDRFKIFWVEFYSLVIGLNLLSDETVSIREDSLTLALHPDRNLHLILDDIIELVNNYQDILKLNRSARIFKKNVPESLRVLCPLLKKWAISDDGEREQAVSSLSEKQKINLVNKVDPFMNQINTFLDSFEDRPLSEEATLIASLAELISELKLTI